MPASKRKVLHQKPSPFGRGQGEGALSSAISLTPTDSPKQRYCETTWLVFGHQICYITIHTYISSKRAATPLALTVRPYLPPRNRWAPPCANPRTQLAQSNTQKAVP